jgi:ubiquinone/menaquinone biosynthesis C-methylase UbiE
MDYDKEQKEIQKIEQFLDCPDRHILEVGCGDGRVSALLAPKARAYIAIDTDPQSLEKARSAYPEVDFQFGDGEALSFADASFNGVLFTLSLHHQESRIALQEAYRVLAENGHVVIVEPAADGEFQQFFNIFDDETDALTQALNAIMQSNFELERHETICAKATFHDHEELCSYPFDRTIHQPNDNDRILETLRRLRGSLKDGQPIHLHDKLHIFSLRRRRSISF